MSAWNALKNATGLAVFSASFSTLEALNNWNGQGTELIFKILKKVEEFDEKGIFVIVQWIPAHVGVHGNDRADKLVDQSSKCLQPEHSATIDDAKK